VHVRDLGSVEQVTDRGLGVVAFDEPVVDLPPVPVVGAEQLISVPEAFWIDVVGRVSGARVSVDEDRPDLCIRSAGLGGLAGEEHESLADPGFPQAATKWPTALVLLGHHDQLVAEVIDSAATNAVEILWRQCGHTRARSHGGSSVQPALIEEDAGESGYVRWASGNPG